MKACRCCRSVAVINDFVLRVVNTAAIETIRTGNTAATFNVVKRIAVV